MPQVSVIVPCYNAERWIRKCVTSLLNQQIRDIEIIVINDGSTDRSREILLKLQKEDSRLKVIDKTNGGVSSARNLGLTLASGEWISFVDIDDEIFSDGIVKMLSVAIKDSEIVFAGYTTNGKRINRGIDRTAECSSEQLARELFEPSDYPYLGYPWAKLFRRSVIEQNNIRFNENIIYNEDRLFTFTYLACISRGVYTTEPVYNYIQHDDNAMSAINGPNFWKFETDLDAFVEMNKIAPAFNSPEITRLVRLGTIASYKWNRRLNKTYGNDNKARKKRLKKKLVSVVPLNLIYQESFTRTIKHIKSINYRVVKRLSRLVR